jgi:predicted peptidase
MATKAPNLYNAGRTTEHTEYTEKARLSVYSVYSVVSQSTGRKRFDRPSPWLMLVLLLQLASTGFGGRAEIQPLPAAGQASAMPAAGIALVPPLAATAAIRQTEFRSNLCDLLKQVPFEARAFTFPGNNGEVLRYRLFKPALSASAQTYPLVLCLHGGGARRSFDDLLNCASPVFAFGPARFVCPAEQSRHAAFVLVPWSGSGGWDEENLGKVATLLEALGREFPLDPKRLYVTGQSMGGYGAWRMLARYPRLFAAAIPICGGGDPASAPKAKDVPIWAFHGSADRLVPVSETRNLIDALLRAGGKPIYWEYQDATHASTAERAYSEPALLDWLFAQSRP